MDPDLFRFMSGQRSETWTTKRTDITIRGCWGRDNEEVAEVNRRVSSGTVTSKGTGAVNFLVCRGWGGNREDPREETK